MDKITYAGLPNCIKLSNEFAELVVTTGVGPRILHYSLKGGENILAVRTDISIDTPLGQWKPYGGHRLWAAPESMPETYYPDNNPVTVEELSTLSLQLTAPVERENLLEKQMTISLDPDSSQVRIEHTITNRSDIPRTFAPWSLTIMKGGGAAIIPQEPYRSHTEALLPARPLVLWSYTDLNDPRISITKEFITIRTDESLDLPQKIGVLNKQGWAAYQLDDLRFIKRFAFVEEASYPDYNSNNEVYTAGTFIELETLGPLKMLAPNEAVLHIERWELHSEHST